MTFHHNTKILTGIHIQGLKNAEIIYNIQSLNKPWRGSGLLTNCILKSYYYKATYKINKHKINNIDMKYRLEFQIL